MMEDDQEDVQVASIVSMNSLGSKETAQTFIQTEKYRNGSCYLGELRNVHDEQQDASRRIRNGLGVFYDAAENYLFRGEWQHDVQDGYGEMVYEETKLRFEGLFSKGRFRGPGRKLWADGTCYIGEFDLKGVPKGLGFFQSTTGESICGVFENGKCHGYGKCFYINGDCYVGSFHDGKRQGVGVLYRGAQSDHFQARESGLWYSGTFVRKVAEQEKLNEILNEAETVVNDAMNFCDEVQQDILQKVRDTRSKVTRVCVTARDEGLVFDQKLLNVLLPPASGSNPFHDDTISDNASMTTATWEDDGENEEDDEDDDDDDDDDNNSNSIENRELSDLVPPPPPSTTTSSSDGNEADDDEGHELHQKAKQIDKEKAKAADLRTKYKKDPVLFTLLEGMQQKLYSSTENGPYLKVGAISQGGGVDGSQEDILEIDNSRVNSIRQFISAKFGKQETGNFYKKAINRKNSLDLDRFKTALSNRMTRPTLSKSAKDDDDDDDDGPMLNARQYALLWKSLHPASSNITLLPKRDGLELDDEDFVVPAPPQHPPPRLSQGSVSSMLPPGHPPPSLAGSTISGESDSVVPNPPMDPPPARSRLSLAESELSFEPIPPSDDFPETIVEEEYQSESASTPQKSLTSSSSQPTLNPQDFNNALNISIPTTLTPNARAVLNNPYSPYPSPSRPRTAPPLAPLRPPYPPKRPPLPPPLQQ